MVFPENEKSIQVVPVEDSLKDQNNMVTFKVKIKTNLGSVTSIIFPGWEVLKDAASREDLIFTKKETAQSIANFALESLKANHELPKITQKQVENDRAIFDHEKLALNYQFISQQKRSLENMKEMQKFSDKLNNELIAPTKGQKPKKK